MTSVKKKRQNTMKYKYDLLKKVNERKMEIYTQDKTKKVKLEDDEVFVPAYYSGWDKPRYHSLVSNYGKAITVKGKVARLYAENPVGKGYRETMDHERVHRLVWFSFAYEALDPKQDNILPCPDIQYKDINKVESIEQLKWIGKQADAYVHHRNLVRDSNLLNNLRLIDRKTHNDLHSIDCQEDEKAWENFLDGFTSGDPDLAKVVTKTTDKKTSKTIELDLYEATIEEVFGNIIGLENVANELFILCALMDYVKNYSVVLEDGSIDGMGDGYFLFKRKILIIGNNFKKGYEVQEFPDKSFKPSSIADLSKVKDEDFDVIYLIDKDANAVIIHDKNKENINE